MSKEQGERLNHPMRENDRIEVFTLGAAQRRMLLEMLASERSEERVLNVALLDRRQTARNLCDQGMAMQCGADSIVFTPFGRRLSESLALRLVDRQHRLAG